MTTSIEEEPGLREGPGGEQPSGGSLMHRIRRKRADLAALRTTDIPIAGYGGDLVARYRLLDPLVEGKEIVKRTSEQFAKEPAEQTYYGIVDSMLEACVGLYARSHGELIPLDDENGYGAMTYSDARLGEFLDFTAENGRDAVVEVFAGNRNAVIAHGMLLQKWFADPSGELDQRTLGV
jgi:hypothetical protein